MTPEANRFSLENPVSEAISGPYHGSERPHAVPPRPASERAVSARSAASRQRCGNETPPAEGPVPAHPRGVLTAELLGGVPARQGETETGNLRAPGWAHRLTLTGLWVRWTTIAAHEVGYPDTARAAANARWLRVVRVARDWTGPLAVEPAPARDTCAEVVVLASRRIVLPVQPVQRARRVFGFCGDCGVTWVWEPGDLRLKDIHCKCPVDGRRLAAGTDKGDVRDAYVLAKTNGGALVVRQTPRGTTRLVAS